MQQRRKLLKWSVPMATAITLPAHSQTSPVVEPPVAPPTEPVASCDFEYIAPPFVVGIFGLGFISYTLTVTGVINNPGNIAIPADPVFYRVNRNGALLVSGTLSINANNEFSAQGTSQIALPGAVPGDQLEVIFGMNFEGCGADKVSNIGPLPDPTP